MVATRLITMHQNKGKSVAKSLSDRTDYAKNGEKTENGQFISSYACQAESVDEEFMLSKREYERLTGRHPRGNIIAYQIRQSFKPGEITPEEANQVGYETAMRFTKGNHAFIVATHTDKAHIHNHIIFNSTSLDCTHKFRDFFFAGLALQRLSDIICLEHGLSVIEKKKPSERVKRTTYANGVKTNVLFFKKGEPTKDIWVYDYRTGVKHTLATKPMTRAHLQDFVDCYCAGHVEDRKATYSDNEPNGRWRCFSEEEVNNAENLDFKWLDLEEKDERTISEVLDDMQAESDIISDTVTQLRQILGGIEI